MKHVFNVIILSLLPFLSFAQDLEFTLPISVSDGANTTNITVAVSPNGSSTSFVEGLDQLAPPAPPDGAFDARMKVNGTSYFTKYFDNALTAKTATFEYTHIYQYLRYLPHLPILSIPPHIYQYLRYLPTSTNTFNTSTHLPIPSIPLPIPSTPPHI